MTEVSQYDLPERLKGKHYQRVSDIETDADPMIIASWMLAMADHSGIVITLNSYRTSFIAMLEVPQQAEKFHITPEEATDGDPAT